VSANFEWPTAASIQPGTDCGGLVSVFESIVGKKHVLTDESATLRYRAGFRFGIGKALAVVRPGSLVEQWRVLKACINANVIVISQASNTGLTGGSTPDGDDYDRDDRGGNAGVQRHTHLRHLRFGILS